MLTKIATVQCVYNDAGPHLRRHLDSEKKLGIPLSVWCDGVWPGFPGWQDGSGLSTDETRDIIREYDHTLLLDCPRWGEKKAMNAGFREVAKRGYDLAVQLSADEWLTGDIDRFLKNAEEVIHDEGKPMYFMRTVVLHITPASQTVDKLPRLHWYPALNKLRFVHWWWFFMNRPVQYGSLIRGLTINHDDRQRDKKRDKMMGKFQQYQAKQEAAAMRYANSIDVPEPIITKLICGCQHGVKFSKFHGALFGHDYSVRCPRHYNLVGVKQRNRVYAAHSPKKIKLFSDAETARLYASKNQLKYKEMIVW